MSAIATQILSAEIVLDKDVLPDKALVINKAYAEGPGPGVELVSTPDGQYDRKVRLLGCVETYQAALQSLDYMRGTILCCRYRIPQPLSESGSQSELVDTFERAVACAVLQHPHMLVGLIERCNKPYWIQLEWLNLSNHIEWYAVPGESIRLDQATKHWSSAELDSSFIDQVVTPGWRIKVLRRDGQDTMEVILVFNHTTMDAGSAHIIHKDIMHSLNDRMAPPENAPLRRHVLTIPRDAHTKLDPAPESLVDFPVSTDFMIKFIQDEIQTPPAEYLRSNFQAHWAPITVTSFSTQWRNITVGSALLGELVQACHFHGVTVTSLIHALVLISLAPLLDESDASAFTSSTAMDVRRFLPSHPTDYPWFDPQRAVSNYVTVLGHAFNETVVARVRSQYSEPTTDTAASIARIDLIWSTAKMVRQDIIQKLEQGTNNDLIGFSQAIVDWRTQLKEEVLRPRRASWVVSNLGVIDGKPSEDQNSDWSIDRVRFIMSANVVAAALGIAIATIRGGDMEITCSWQSGVIDGDMGEAFVASLTKWLSFVVSFDPTD